ncbi:hypothetical protein HHK36_011517 [Tetracentron sinense]|uniref:prolycopene isomerase n=1 Tax=Tetracentron sinense TaxID=13715 RepID=A0A835DKH8_TETSI|nr:hypothetical protein HHK36_011517 [Tetracentron sinense]
MLLLSHSSSMAELGFRSPSLEHSSPPFTHSKTLQLRSFIHRNRSVDFNGCQLRNVNLGFCEWTRRNRNFVVKSKSVLSVDKTVERDGSGGVGEENYDAIVIGSGIGGLVAGTQLAVKGARVLVLEKYVIPGGSSGYYQREGFTFDVGSSVMFGFSDKGNLNLITQALAAVDCEMQVIPDPTTVHFHLPNNLSIRVHREYNDFITELTNSFPHEKEGILKFYSECWKIFNALNSLELKSLEEPIYLFGQFFQKPIECLTLVAPVAIKESRLASPFVKAMHASVEARLPTDNPSRGAIPLERFRGKGVVDSDPSCELGHGPITGLQVLVPNLFCNPNGSREDVFSSDSTSLGARGEEVSSCENDKTYYLPQNAGAIARKFIRDPQLLSFIDAECFIVSTVNALQTPMINASMVLCDRHFGGINYPVGGVGGIAKSLAKGLVDRGSKLLYKANVTRIILEHGKAVGVRLSDGREFFSKTIISNATRWDTFGKLLKGEDLPKEEENFQKIYVMAPSFLSIHIGVKAEVLPPDTDCHHFMLENDWTKLEEPYGSIFLSIPTVLDSSLAPEGRHILHIFTTSCIEDWQGLAQKDYEAKKELVADEIIGRLEKKLFPGLKSSIVFKEVGTPKTHRRFLARDNGTYGPMPRRIPKGLLGMPFNTTAIDGLYCVGDSCFPGQGVIAVAFSGVMCAHRVAADIGKQDFNGLPQCSITLDWLGN